MLYHRPIVTPPAAWYLPTGLSSADVQWAYQPKGGGGLAASYRNLNRPGTNNTAPGVAPAWAAATGWTFDGASQYLVAGDVNTQPENSLFVRFSGLVTSGGRKTLVGAYHTSGGGTLGVTYNAGNMESFHGYPNKATNASLTAGVLGIAGYVCYRDGVAEPNVIPTGGVSTIHPLYIGALNYNAGTATQFAALTVAAVVLYRVTLSAAQAAQLTASMEDL